MNNFHKIFFEIRSLLRICSNYNKTKVNTHIYIALKSKRNEVF